MNFKTDILPLKDCIFRIALQITMCREEAEDIVQDTLIKLWNQRERLSEIHSLEAYATTLARNHALDLLKKHSSSNVSFEENNFRNLQGENPYDRIYAKENVKRIHCIMEQLPEKQRTCMFLRDFEEKNYKEIAEIMSISEDQVKINIYRARQFVKKNMNI